MKKQYSIFILLFVFDVLMFSCDFGNNPEGYNDPVGCREGFDTLMVFMNCTWVCGDTLFWVTNHDLSGGRVDETTVFFKRKDPEYDDWIHFPYRNGQGLPVRNLTVSSFECNWMGSSMIAVYYELESSDEIGSNHVTITYPGYKKVFSLYTE